MLMVKEALKIFTYEIEETEVSIKCSPASRKKIVSFMRK